MRTRLFTLGWCALLLAFAVNCDRTGQFTQSQQIVEVIKYVELQHPPQRELESPPTDREIFPAEGATEFLTANENELVSNPNHNYYDNGYNGRESLADGESDFGGAPAGASEPGASYEPEAEPDPMREIVEADIYKVEGDYLYILNAYRGLVIFDLSIPDQPRVASRLALQGQPVEMYVREGRAYFLLSDHFSFWQYDPEADPLGFHGSEVIIADVSDPTAPFLLGKQRVDGEITDSRMVGDVLYVVSKRNPEYWRYNTGEWNDRTWVLSISIADPMNIHEIDRVTFEGTSTLIHVAAHAIFVAAIDPNYYLYDSEHDQETKVTYVDISDPAGDLRVRGDIYVPGIITDKFKMDWFDHSFRVFSQRWQNGRRTELHVYDTNYPDNLTEQGALVIQEELYGNLRGTRFDGARGFAEFSDYRYSNGYSIPIDRLLTIALGNPAAPEQVGSLVIDGYISHFETRGDRLIAFGQEYHWYTSNYRYRAQVSLFDVSVLSQPRQLSQAELGFGNSWSSGNWDYKAFKVIDELNLILTPVSWYEQTPSYVSHTGTQLVDWYGDTLTARGFIDHPDWNVRRVFVARDRVIALSERSVQVINAANRGQPVVTAAVHLVRAVMNAYNVQGKEIQIINNTDRPGCRVDVLDFGKDDDRPVLATLDLPFRSAPVCFQDGNLIRMIGFVPSTYTQMMTTLDVSNPVVPRLRGHYDVPNDVDRIYNEGYSFYYVYWSPWSGLPLEGRIFPVTMRRVIERADGRRNFESHLRLIDFSDIDNPRMTLGAVPMNDWPFVNKVTHGNMLYSTHVEEAVTPDGDHLQYHVRSYIDRIDVNDPDNPLALPKINVPGVLVDTSDDGRLLYTIDYQWDAYGRRRNSLNVLTVDGDVATLRTVLPVGDRINRALFRDRTLWVTTHKYPWWGVHSDSVASRQPYTLLNRIDFGQDGELLQLTSADLQGYHFDLLDVQEPTVFLASGYPYGVLVLDATDPTLPVIVTDARTIGYVSKIVFAGAHIYMPLGWYGVHRTPRFPGIAP
ncbi:MAG: beta-propeller domain-containing protein [Deltaproteobacteria bacterium]|nr:beta-propeller domain-containing protein [Deltaproteobacteria bacterium]